MTTKTHYKPFDAATVPLQGSNLIEASAGTGKTYSIAIMVLRLLLQKKLSVKDILMVTFTKAAVAELEERIRLFIRNAAKVSNGETIKDSLITKIVSDAIANDGEDEVQRLLKEAVLFLDETSVLTIHSFCQQALTEFAFETGQIFGADTLQDTAQLIADSVAQFWRTKITTLPVELLEVLIGAGLKQDALAGILKEQLNGKKFMAYEEGMNYDCDDVTYAGWIEELGEFKKAEEDLRSCLEKEVREMNADLQQRCSKGRPKQYLQHLVDDVPAFLSYISEKRNSNYIKDDALFSELVRRVDECGEAIDCYNDKIRTVINHLYCLAIEQAIQFIGNFKQRNNLLTFEDMIVNLHKAITNQNIEKLVACLKQKYKAVFVDEFQDTDRLQYEIFQTAFGKDHILFYIGDPKQSIYAWRKADIFTYFKARAAVNNIYEMNQNFRSSAPFIAAMNSLFKVEDPFFFEGEKDSIDYINVETPAPNTKGVLLKGGKEDVPITITTHDNKPSICAAVAGQVVALLSTDEFKIFRDGEEQIVKPSNIGILVRSHKEGADIKAQLSQYGIPAVTIGDAKVLDTEEAAHVWYLLQAMQAPSEKTIARALLSPFTGYTTLHIQKLDEERVMELFKGYKKTWEEDGVYTALMNFVADFAVRKRLLQPEAKDDMPKELTPQRPVAGERVITNLFQLIEVVHKVQTHKALSPIELIAWLKRAMDGLETEGDEYQQRIESDEEAVKIVTIHKSKGLEYKIVLAPFLDFIHENPFDTCSFRHPETGDYIAGEKKFLSEEQKAWLETQTEQEFRRLIYVAITRAVYKCFLYRNTSDRGPYKTINSSLAPFVTAVQGADASMIEWGKALTVPEGYHYAQGRTAQPLAGARIAENFSLQQQHWRRMSYTGLAAKGEHTPKSSGAATGNAYDDFVFSHLPRGLQTGNLLHHIFENIDFGNESRWPALLQQALNRFVSPHDHAAYLPMLQQLLKEVLGATITVEGISFSLSEVPYHQRIHEFEFDFTVPAFQPKALNHLSDETMMVAVKDLPQMEGLLNGKMDLFFEYKGKCYVLDWKSNFLGDSVEDYAPEKLAEAMNENNYHLQYLLYTLAAKKYLKSRLGNAFDYERDFGGVIYLFVRGVRKGMSNGIFTCKPGKEQLEKVNQLLTTKYKVPSVPGHELENVGEEVL